MIIFYEKTTGKIVGTIEGRVHGYADMDQWIGKRNITDRKVVGWVKKDDSKWEPNIDDQEQRDIYIKLDKNPTSVYDYSIDTVSGKLVQKEKV